MGDGPTNEDTRMNAHQPSTLRPTRRAISLGMVGVVMLAIGCTGSETDRSTSIDELPQLVFEEELRLGSVDDPVVGFTSIGDVWVSPAGELWLAERRAREIRVYDHEGALLRTYGRQGDGPGEFQSVGDFGLVGDTLWVSDGSLSRTTLFSLDGDVLETVTARVEIPVTDDFMGRPVTVNLFAHALRPDGLIGSTFVRMVRPNLPDSVVQVPQVVFNRQGEVVDTVEMVETTVSRRAEVIEYENGSSMIYHEPPAFDSGTSALELDNGAFALHWSALDGLGQGRILASLVAPTGDTTFLQRIQYDPRPVTGEYLDSLARRRTRSGLSRRDSLKLFDAARTALQRPDHHRPLGFPIAIGEGSLWTQLDPDDPATNQWLVFLEKERAIGTVALPVGAFPMWGDGTFVWVRENDEFDVPWLVRYRIGAPTRSQN